MKFEKIKLEGGAEVYVDMHARMTCCKKCQKEIKFGKTINGKIMPIIQKSDGSWQSHFADCDYAALFRRTDNQKRIAETEKNQDFLNNL